MKSESEVAQSCLTLHNPMDCSLPDSSVHGIFQATVLEWGAIVFSERGSLRQHKNYPMFWQQKTVTALKKDLWDWTSGFRILYVLLSSYMPEKVSHNLSELSFSHQ